MEDAVGFDVLGMIVPAKPDEAIKHLVVGQVFPSEFAARKAVNKSCNQGAPVRLAKSVGWDGARTFARSCAWASDIALCQEGCRPSDEDMEFCDAHALYYGGILVCPVCSDFYRE